MKTPVLMLGLTCLAAVASGGETITMTGDDATSASKEARSFAAAYNWSSEKEPEPGFDYDTVGHILSTVDGNVGPFAGDSLIVRGTNVLRKTLSLVWFGGSGKTFTPGSNITLDDGCFVHWRNRGKFAEGTFKVNGTEVLPVVFNCIYSDPCSLSFAASFEGDATSCVKFRSPNASSTVVQSLTFGTAAWPAFRGKLYLEGGASWQAATFRTPGGIVLLPETSFSLTAASGSSSLGALDMSAGSTLDIGKEQTVSVTGSLVFSPESRLRSNRLPTSVVRVVAPTNVVFALAAGVPVPERLPQLLDNCPDATGEPNARWAVVPRQDGGNDLAVTCYPVISLTNNCTASESPFMTGDSSEVAVHYLNDGQPVGPNKHYHSGTRVLTLLYDEPTVFPGASLTVANRFALYRAFDVTIADLRFDDGYQVQQKYDSRTYALRGTLKMLGTGEFGLGNGCKMMLYSDMSGTADVVFCLKPRDETYKHQGAVSLLGDNSLYAGRIVLGSAASDTNMTLTVASNAGLGGARAEPLADAVTIARDNTLVLQGSNVVYQADNRGWTLADACRVEVPAGGLSTVADPIALQGTVTKRGAGTLVLADAPTVTGGGVSVAEGGFGFGAETSLAGRTVTFGDGTSWILPLGPAGNDFAVRGVDATADGAAIVFPDAKVPMVGVVTDGSLESGTSFSRGVATFAAEAEARRVAGGLKPRPISVNGVRLSGSVDVNRNPDDTWTVTVSYDRHGVLLIVR